MSGDLLFLNEFDEAYQHGAPSGRRAAAEALAEFSGTESNGVVLRAIDDSDLQVQAHLVRQLRERGIPGTLQRLLVFAES